jgi:serine-type D-Ala-D-Ala endopeptidase (penicillin-binding protein 7)
VRSKSSFWVVRVLTALLSLGVAGPSIPAFAETSSSASAAKGKTTAKKKTVSRSKTTRSRYSRSAARARRARLARARAAARIRSMREAMTPQFKTDASGAVVPDIRAAAAIVLNPETGEVLFAENAQDKRSIASITKVMTAVVFLEDNPDLSQEYVIDRGDVRAASTTFLRAGERVRGEDLLHLTLIASDNAAARALARNSHGGTTDFVDRMNQKALELGLENTAFTDPSGLHAENVSSAFDLSRLIAFAASDERIGPVMRKADYTVSTSRRTVTVHNTNRLLGGEMDVRGGKTGFIYKAGYCLATLLKLPQGDQVAVVVLGARNNALRFMETKHIFNWVNEKTSGILGKPPVQPQPLQPQPQTQP